MNDDVMAVYVRNISETGEIIYEQPSYDDYGEADLDRLPDVDIPDIVEFPELDHIRVIEHTSNRLDGEVGLISEISVLASAPSIVALAGLIKAFLLRNKKREVHLFWPNGKPRLIVKGDLSVDEITRLLQEGSANDASNLSPGEMSSAD